MAKGIGSIGGAVVFTKDGDVPEVVCEFGKEPEALELLDRMGLIELMRPDDGRRPAGTMKPFAERGADDTMAEGHA